MSEGVKQESKIDLRGKDRATDRECGCVELLDSNRASEKKIVKVYGVKTWIMNNIQSVGESEEMAGKV